MEFFRIQKDIPFMRHALVFNVISFVTFALAVFFLISRGLHLSVEFTGGTLVEVSYTQAANLEKIREGLGKAGYNDIVVQNFGSSQDVMIRMPLKEEQNSAKIGEAVMGVLDAEAPGASLRRVEFVGPQVGKELQRSGLVAIGLSLIGMIIYITIRFEFSFAVGAVVGLLHNLLITIGLYCVFPRQFTTTTIAALLTVLGYSVNDTIVVFDRIRETRKLRAGRLDPAVVNESVNATLSRTLLTSFTTLLSVVMLMVFGGGSIFDFALAMFIGVVAGTYSSIFIASPIMLAVRPKVAAAPAGK